MEPCVAIVTGAAQGIGAAFARRLAAEGCTVVLTDRRDAVLGVASELADLGHTVEAAVGDVADAAHVAAVVADAVTQYGPIGLLVNNAGEVAPTGPFDPWERAEADFDRVFGSNTKGAYLFGRAVVPSMIEGGGGNIVNISTDHVKPGPGCDRHHGHGAMDLYNASKWALNGFTFDWARALRKHGIRVNNICMGATDTEMLRGWLGGPGQPEPDPEYVATWMQPEQIAQILVELIDEGPDGRTADSIGLYAGQPCVLPPPFAV